MPSKKPTAALPKGTRGKKLACDYRREDNALLHSKSGAADDCLAFYRVGDSKPDILLPSTYGPTDDTLLTSV